MSVALVDYARKIRQGCRLATQAALATGTYYNGIADDGVGATFTVTATGTLTVDSVVSGLGDRILVKNQATAYQNGIYAVTIAGAVGVSAVLTRVSDFDTSAEIVRAIIPITEGAVSTGLTYQCVITAAITMGTTSLVFSLFPARGRNAVTATYTITDDDDIISATSGTFTITIPTAVGRTGKQFTIKNIGATLTLATTSTQTIDGTTVPTLSANDFVTIVSDGANWIIVGKTITA